MKRCALFGTVVLVSSLAVLTPVACNAGGPAFPGPFPGRFGTLHVSSATITDGGTMPTSTLLTPGSSSILQCPFITAGGDQSPEVAWANVPPRTQSFAVTMFDTTAAFTHWGMYDIAPGTRELPAGAGVAGSAFGQQIFNDFFDPQYDGPCPPPAFAPVVHEYVVTVYALDTWLNLASNPPYFPANSETLYRAMFDHVLSSGSIHAYYSTAPTP